MLGQDRCVGAHHGGAFDSIAELADVAWPGVAAQHLQRGRRDRGSWIPLQISARSRQECGRERLDLQGPLP